MSASALMVTREPTAKRTRMSVLMVCSASFCFTKLSRVIALPSVKYIHGQVEADVIESRLGLGETGRKPACHN